MRTDTFITIFDLIIFLGVFQGIFLSWFFIKNRQRNKMPNLYQGLLLLFLSMGIFEELLNNTGYIVKVLAISNFSEPMGLAFAPGLYFYIFSSLHPNEKKRVWPHFIPAVFWLFYNIFHWAQPDALKYNSYIQTKHPDWEYLDVIMKIPEDPLGLRYYYNQMLAFQFIAYIIASIVVVVKKFRELNQSLFRTGNKLLAMMRNTTIHFIIIILVFLITKSYFGIHSDIGGYWIASYISFMIFLTSYQALNQSDFFDQPGSFLSFPITKYKKSSLSEEDKSAILSKITTAMEQHRYFSNNLASLSGLSKEINETTHSVSQVINEKLGKNFFELLAGYRVEHAKKLISADKDAKITVEELADMVGYNSKSSFNTAFKKITSQTPSEYRKSLEKS